MGTIRQRAVRAVCAVHNGTHPCEVGQATAAAVLAEVRVWLLELRDSETDPAWRDALSTAAQQIGPGDG